MEAWVRLRDWKIAKAAYEKQLWDAELEYRESLRKACKVLGLAPPVWKDERAAKQLDAIEDAVAIFREKYVMVKQRPEFFLLTNRQIGPISAASTESSRCWHEEGKPRRR